MTVYEGQINVVAYDLAGDDRERTGRWRCIGCGRFLRNDGNWNQCPDCDTREPWEMR